MDDRKRKWVYWSTFCTTLVFWNAAWFGGLGVLGWLVSRNPFQFSGGIGSVYLVFGGLWLSAFQASQRCRRLGLSLEGKVTETLTRREPVATDEAPERVTTGTSPRSFAIAGIVLALIAEFICGWVYFRGNANGYWWHQELGYIMAGIFGGGALACWLSALTNAGRLFVADVEGVTRCSLLPGMAQRIPWERIARYDIHSECNVLGRTTTTICTLYDAAGKELLRLNLSELPEEQRRHFLDAIRMHQGASTRTELIAAEAPAGLGTELEATQAPAGRGTEPMAEASPAPAQEEPARAPLSRWRNRGHG